MHTESLPTSNGIDGGHEDRSARPIAGNESIGSSLPSSTNRRVVPNFDFKEISDDDQREKGVSASATLLSSETKGSNSKPLFTYLSPHSADHRGPSSSSYLASLSPSSPTCSRYDSVSDMTPTEVADTLKEALLAGEEGELAVKEYLAVAEKSNRVILANSNRNRGHSISPSSFFLRSLPLPSSSSSSAPRHAGEEAESEVSLLSSPRRTPPLFDINTRDSKGETALHHAARKNDLPLLRFLLRNTNVDSSVRNSKGQTALHVAAVSGNADAVSCLLLKHQPSPRHLRQLVPTQGGMMKHLFIGYNGTSTALLTKTFSGQRGMEVVRAGHRFYSLCAPLEASPALRRMPAAGLRVGTVGGAAGVHHFSSNLLSSRCALDLTPLQHAAALGHASVIDTLLPFYMQEHNPAAQQRLFRSPPTVVIDALQLAASSGHIGCVKSITKALLNPSSSSSSSSPSATEIRFGEEQWAGGWWVMKWLSGEEGHCWRSAPTSKVLKESNTAHSQSEVNVGLSLSSGVFARNPNDGRTLLHAAAYGGSQEVLSYVLSLAGLGLNTTSMATDTSEAELGKNLLPFGGGTAVSAASLVLDEQDNAGSTPLHIACREGSERAVALILNALLLRRSMAPTATVGIEARETQSTVSSGITNTLPSHQHSHAEKENDASMPSSSSFLRYYNALVRTDTSGNSALLLAAKGGHTRIVRMLMDAWGGAGEEEQPSQVVAPPYSSSSLVASSGFLSHLSPPPFSLENFINCGNSHNGDTALHLAALYGHASVVKALLRGGGDPSARCYGGVTTLHKAAQGGSSEVIRTLTSRREDRKGVVVDGGERGRGGDTVLLLHNKGTNTPSLSSCWMDPNVKDSRGITPLHTAVMFNNLGAVKALLDAGARIADQKDQTGRDPRQYANLHRKNSKIAHHLNSYAVRFTDFTRRVQHRLFPEGPPETFTRAIAFFNSSSNSQERIGSADGDFEAASITKGRGIGGTAHSSLEGNINTKNPELRTELTNASRSDAKQQLQQQLYLAIMAGMCLVSGTMVYLVFSIIRNKQRQSEMEEEMRRAEAEADPEAEWCESEEVCREEARQSMQSKQSERSTESAEHQNVADGGGDGDSDGSENRSPKTTTEATTFAGHRDCEPQEEFGSFSAVAASVGGASHWGYMAGASTSAPSLRAPRLGGEEFRFFSSDAVASEFVQPKSSADSFVNTSSPPSRIPKFYASSSAANAVRKKAILSECMRDAYHRRETHTAGRVNLDLPDQNVTRRRGKGNSEEKPIQHGGLGSSCRGGEWRDGGGAKLMRSLANRRSSVLRHVINGLRSCGRKG